ncbi:MAG: replicative helicase loader/inhibitor [Ruthenibacterium sp.]
MTRDEVKTLMAAIRAVWQKFCDSDTNRKAAIDLWAVALADTDVTAAQAALVEHIKTSAYEPKPADLLRLVPQKNKATTWMRACPKYVVFSFAQICGSRTEQTQAQCAPNLPLKHTQNPTKH